MCPDWEPQRRPSWLCLKEGESKATVVRLSPGATLGPSLNRMYELWVNGVKVYDPANDFKPGQVIKL